MHILVTKPNIKNQSALSFTDTRKKNWWIHAFPNFHKGKQKQLQPGFELRSPILFSMTITFMLSTSPHVDENKGHPLRIWLTNNRIVWFGFIFDGILTFIGYLMPNPYLLMNSSGTI